MKKKFLIFIAILVVSVGVFPPILAPVIHNDSSSTSAIRNYIYKQGYPYQSFFALIRFQVTDPEYGELYKVAWIDWDSPTGDTETLFYAKKAENGTYKVEAGTGP